MAEVNKEIVKRIFCVSKDNGQSIQLNIIKWGRNSSKYDLRVWDGEKSLKGFTLSDGELKKLCGAIASRYRKTGEREAERMTFDVREMEEIDLKRILEEHPECRDDFNRLRAVMRDLYPKKTLEVNLILNVLHCGITGQMMRMKEVNTRDMKRFVYFMESQYGVSERYSVGAVLSWAKALDIPCNIKASEVSETNTGALPQRDPLPEAPGAVKGHKYGDLVFENEDIAVTYKGVYKFNGLFAQGYRIRFFIENKTGQKLRISGKNISADGLVVASDDLFNSEVAAHKKVVDTVLMPKNSLNAAGISKVADMNSLAIQFEYDNGQVKKRTSEITMEPYEVKE